MFYKLNRLNSVVEKVVFAENEEHSRKLIFPQGKAVLGIQLQGSMSLEHNAGLKKLQNMGITGFQNELRVYHSAPQTSTILVHFTPWGLRAFLGEPAFQLAGKCAGMQEFAVAYGSFLDQLSECKSNLPKILETLESFILGECLKVNCANDPRILAATERILFLKGKVKISRLAEELAISTRQLERKFLEWIGVSPSEYAHVVRMQTIFDDMRKGVNWSDIVESAGFYDQPHFIKAFKKMFHEPPSQFMSHHYNQPNQE
jgi:AraC-like DNA-binding protein